MSLYKFFARVEKGETSRLPDPRGTLSKVIPSSSIAAANTEVEKCGQSNPAAGKRKQYAKFTPEQRAEIGRRAAEHGVASTIRYYASQYSLKESTIRGWRDSYIREMKKRKMENKPVNVTELPEKRRGRPLLLGEELDRQVQAYVTALRKNGAVVNTAIVMACAEGIVRSKNSNLLCSNGGHISLTKDWAKSLLHRMGLVKRRASTKSKVSVENFKELKEQYLLDIKASVEMDEVPDELIINWDQTGIHYVPVSSWTMEKEGSKRVEIAGIDDKRQITAVFGCSVTGDFLPIQIIYKGKTKKCLPSFAFPPDWHVTFSHNHWSNECTMQDYINKVLLPYIKRKRIELKLSSDQRALVIFDQFKGQCTSSILELLEENNISIVTVPANCTDRLQPLDVSVNKPAKNFLREQFQDWYATQICDQLKADKDASKFVDLKLSIMKPLGAKWMVSMYDYFLSKPEIIRNGFKGAGITTNSKVTVSE